MVSKLIADPQIHQNSFSNTGRLEYRTYGQPVLSIGFVEACRCGHIEIVTLLFKDSRIQELILTNKTPLHVLHTILLLLPMSTIYLRVIPEYTDKSSRQLHHSTPLCIIIIIHTFIISATTTPSDFYLSLSLFNSTLHRFIFMTMTMNLTTTHHEH